MLKPISSFIFLCLANLATAAVDFTSGQYEGLTENKIVSIKGIRYAASIDAGQRWHEPEPFISRDKFTGRNYGAQCPQPSRNGSNINIQEDCLFLNVWAPENAKDLPVMVWIHGGGFRYGSGEIVGEQLAVKGVVVVSMNYRLGPLGFIKHPMLPNTSANLGLKDMELALQWVQDNINKVGGDPSNVTIFGVSAGGMAVNMLLVSPHAKGLFHKAIAHSGYGTWPLERTSAMANPVIKHWSGDTPRNAETAAKDMFNTLAPSATDIDDLQAIDAMQLINAISGFQLPIVDGVSLLEEPAILMSRGQYNQVPLITGGNQYEGSVMPGAKVTSEIMMDWFFDDATAIEKAYASDMAVSKQQGWQRMFGDVRYLLSALVSAKASEKVGMPVYLYYHQQSGAPEKNPLGMPHGSDAYVLWYGHQAEDSQTHKMADMMRDYWVQFAKTGNPNKTGFATWPSYNSQQGNWQVFNNNSENQQHHLTTKFELLESLYEKRLTP